MALPCLAKLAVHAGSDGVSPAASRVRSSRWAGWPSAAWTCSSWKRV